MGVMWMDRKMGQVGRDAVPEGWTRLLLTPIQIDVLQHLELRRQFGNPLLLYFHFTLQCSCGAPFASGCGRGMRERQANSDARAHVIRPCSSLTRTFPCR